MIRDRFRVLLNGVRQERGDCMVKLLFPLLWFSLEKLTSRPAVIRLTNFPPLRVPQKIRYPQGQERTCRQWRRHKKIFNLTSYSKNNQKSPKNISWLYTNCLRKRPIFRDATQAWTLPLVSQRNDVWVTKAEVPYWWRVTSQIWVVYLTG